MGAVKALYTEWLSKQKPCPLDDGQLTEEEEQKWLTQFANEILGGQITPSHTAPQPPTDKRKN